VADWLVYVSEMQMVDVELVMAVTVPTLVIMGTESFSVTIIRVEVNHDDREWYW